MTPLELAVLDFLRQEECEDHESYPGDDCKPCSAKKHMRDILAAGTVDEVPQPQYCIVINAESRNRRLLIRFGSLMLALKRLDSDARAYTTNQQMSEAARAWSKYHAVKAELHDLEPSLAGIRWEDFK